MSAPMRPADAACLFPGCSKAFGQLSSILRVIEKKAPNDCELRKLICAAVRLADEIDNTAEGCDKQIRLHGIRL